MRRIGAVLLFSAAFVLAEVRPGAHHVPTPFTTASAGGQSSVPSLGGAVLPTEAVVGEEDGPGRLTGSVGRPLASSGPRFVLTRPRSGVLRAGQPRSRRRADLLAHPPTAPPGID